MVLGDARSIHRTGIRVQALTPGHVRSTIRRMKWIPILFLSVCASCRTVSYADGASAIQSVVRAQEAAWNRGDVDGYMAEGYWRSPELTFFSGCSVTRGYDPVLARYAQRYKADGKEMGHLAFKDLEVVMLAEDAALVRGRWDLDFERQPDVGGLFSLIVRHTPDGWRIVHDHTSVDG